MVKKFLSAVNPLTGIAPRLTLWFLVFGAVPATCLVGVYLWFKTDIEDAFRAPLQDTAVSLGDTIDRNLFERYGDVQAFGLNGLAHDRANWRKAGADNPLVKAMDGYMANYGLYTLMLLVDPQGQLLAVNSADKTGKALDTAKLYEQNFADAPWFKDAIAGKFLEGDGLTGTSVQQPAFNPMVGELYGTDGYSIVFSAMVRNLAGETVGVWVNFADFGLVDDIVKTFHADLIARGVKSAEITILDEAGRDRRLRSYRRRMD
jgi:methyl-accepting chemotaxis protein